MDKLVLVSKNPSLLFFRLILYLAIFVCLAQNLFYCVSWNISIRYLLDPWLPPLQLCRAICGQLSRAKTKPETFFPEKNTAIEKTQRKKKTVEVFILTLQIRPQGQRSLMGLVLHILSNWRLCMERSWDWFLPICKFMIT